MNSFEDRTGLPPRKETLPPSYAYMILGGVTMRQWFRDFVCLFRGHRPYDVMHCNRWLYAQCKRCHRVG